MNCPDCGGEMWDNRREKRQKNRPKWPDYKCRNRDCDKAVWLERTKNNGATANKRSAEWTLAGLSRRYQECYLIATRLVSQKPTEQATPADYLAATATLFIAALRVLGPPRPKPQPRPEPEDDGDDTAESAYADDDGGALPF